MLKVSTAKERRVDLQHGVSITVRRFTLKRRERACADVAEAAQKWRDLVSEYSVLKEATEPDTARISEIEKELARLNQEEISPNYFKHGLLGIEGLEIDGEEATVETVKRLVAEIEADDWPDIFHDILLAILHEFRVEDHEAGESEPPTTSPS